MQDSPSTYKSSWYSSPACRTMNWQVQLLIKREWWRPLVRLMRKRERRWCMDPLAVVVLAVLLPSTAWCIPHLRVSCADYNSSRTGAIAHNSNHGNFSSSSTMLVPHPCIKLPSGHHNGFPSVTSSATTVRRWGTLLKSATSPNKASHHELWHPWSISIGAIRRVMCHGLAAPTIPPWKRFTQEKKC
jgi:hypothetical protein